tara:strand:- start:12323 stop:12679 length:357 start_codon:yes stop_codon:yes gene_type:complete
MKIDVRSLFDQLVGYEFYSFSVVSGVIRDRVKCTDGFVLEFDEVVDELIFEGEEILLLRARRAEEEIKQFRQSLRDENDWSMDDFLTAEIRIARQYGFSVHFIAIVDETVYRVLGVDC